MTKKELNKLIDLVREVKKISRKYDIAFDDMSIRKGKVCITEEMYDEMCNYMKVKQIGLFGVS